MALDAAVGDHRHARVPHRQPALDERLQLRHAEARRHPRRAAAAGPDADLDAVGSALEQKPRALGGGDVAGDHLDLAEPLAELAHGPLHHDRVAVSDVDDEDVHAGSHELGRALQIVARGADRGADAQPALLVARGKRQAPLVHQVARRDQAEQPSAVVDERKLLHLALGHDALGLGRLERALMHHEPVERRHPLGDAPVAVVDEAHVALGQESLQPALGIDDDERADARARHEPQRLRNRGRFVDAVGVVDDAVLGPLDDLDLADLRLDLAGPEAPVDDADPALFGLHDGHRRAGHRIHVGGDDRALQRDAAGETAGRDRWSPDRGAPAHCAEVRECSHRTCSRARCRERFARWPDR